MKRDRNKCVPHARLLEIMHYDPATGVFTWKISPRANVSVGDIAGGVDAADGYRRIDIDFVRYRANQLAWFYVTGEWAAELVDHRNLVRDDNPWLNLREATCSQNRANSRADRDNQSGLKGAYFRKESGRYRSILVKNGVRHHLGHFDTAEEAHHAYCQAAVEFHGEFARGA